MKWMTEFTVNKVQDVEEIEKRDENGVQVEVKKTVRKDVPIKLLIKKPNRSLKELAEFYYARILSKAIQENGIISRALLEKRIMEDDGILTKEEKKKLETSLKTIAEETAKLRKLLMTPDAEKSEEVNKETMKVQEALRAAQRDTRSVYAKNQAIFENTAEEIAQRRTITWWVLYLTYIEENGTTKPYFGDGDIEAKLRAFDAVEDNEDIFGVRVFNEAFMYVYLWLTEGYSTPEEFKLIQEQIKNA